MRRAVRGFAWIALGAGAVACTYHPPGERRERAVAAAAGAPFVPPQGCRTMPALPESPRAEDLVRHALLTSPDVEAAYWEWRSALERVPQAGTPETTLAVFGSFAAKGQGSAWDRTTLGLQNDPMSNLPPPSRIEARARRALEEARAAGHRFEQAKWDVRRRVLDAWFEYALLAETIRIAESDAGQWELSVASVEGRVEAGQTGQHGLLAARTSLDLSRSEVASLRSRVPGQVAAVNAILARPSHASLPPPAPLADEPPLAASDEAFLALAARTSPSLAALDADRRARCAAVDEARTRASPELSLSGSITGDVARTIGGMVTVPFLRREAIRAAIDEARAGVRSSEARRRGGADDLAARIAGTLSSIRDADRRIALFQGTIVPRAEQGIDLTRAGYSAGKSDYLEIRDAQSTWLDARRSLVEVRVERARSVARLEALLGRPLASIAGSRTASTTTTPAPLGPATR